MIGERLFDFLSAESMSPRIQQQKPHYVSQFGRAFRIFVQWVYLFPILLVSANKIVEGIRPPVWQSFMFDLMLFIPEYSYQFHGGLIVATGSLLLAKDLFDNFLVDEVEPGTTLALLHAGVAFLLTGTAFQNPSFFETNFSPPNPEYWVILPHLKPIFGPHTNQNIHQVLVRIEKDLISSMLYFSYDIINIGSSIMPFLIPIFSVIFLGILYRIRPKKELLDSVQTEITSNQWGSLFPTEENILVFSGSETRIRSKVRHSEEIAKGFTLILECRENNVWVKVSEHKFEVEEFKSND